ncbi:MAG: tetratricopeptide repeat protein [Anaerolineales bacterium]|nr:tetratricopeptide repeat protein [Anaerolineales bacterium]
MTSSTTPYVLLIFALILTGCVPQQGPVVTTVVEAATALPSPTVTHTPPTPTATQAPTETQIPTATISLKPTSTPKPLPTLDYTADMALRTIILDLVWQMGDYELYLAILDEMTKYNNTPEQLATLYSSMGDAYDTQGNLEEAVQYYLKAQETSPDTVQVNNMICWDYALMGEAEKALPYCEQAVNDDPGSQSHDSRGLAYALLDQLDPAAQDFQVVVDLLKSSTDPELMKIYTTRKAWLQSLKAGTNPITPATLVELREEEVGSVMPTQTTEEKDGVLSEKFQEAAAEVGFGKFQEKKLDTGATVLEAHYQEASCRANVTVIESSALPDYQEGDAVKVERALMGMFHCSDVEQDGLGMWFIFSLIPDKRDLAKAIIWSREKFYYVIEQELLRSEKDVGAYTLEAEYHSPDDWTHLLIIKD